MVFEPEPGSRRGLGLDLDEGATPTGAAPGRDAVRAAMDGAATQGAADAAAIRGAPRPPRLASDEGVARRAVSSASPVSSASSDGGADPDGPGGAAGPGGYGRPMGGVPGGDGFDGSGGNGGYGSTFAGGSHGPERRHAWWSRLATALLGGLLGGGLVLYAVTAGPLAVAPGRGVGGVGSPTATGREATETPPTASPPIAAGDTVVDFSAVYERVAPSVVRVVRTARGINPWLGIVEEESSGSGVVIDEQGHVVTNFHVVEDASQLLVVLDDGTQVEARLVAQDPSHDLALLQADLPADRVRPARLGDSDALKVGEPVMAVGYPFGLPKTATTGVISGLHRNDLQAPNGRIIREVIQTDAPINPGNSGGALVNARGEVIGINTAILSTSPSPGSIGIGFAVPINILKREMDLFLAGGTVQHPWLGIGGLAVDADSYRQRGLAVDHGVQVVEVVPGGPADRAGLQPAQYARMNGALVPMGGDVIVAVDGQPVRDVPDLVGYLDQKRVGDRVTLHINRDGRDMQVPVVLGAFPDERRGP
ncbi:MAG TPA: trypsin-like peptidase domain-containing protein [Thermaerobacter sp.]